MASTKRKRSRESASTEPSGKRQTLESRTLTVPSNGRTPESRTPTSRKSRKGRTLTTTATGRKRRGRSKNPSSPISRSRKRPKVLQLAYRDGLCHPLNCIILSLLPAAAPPSPMECPSCGGSTCLLCLGHHYLIREDDPPEYRELVTAAYCYLPPTAPPPPTHFGRVGWNQKQIVAKVMEELPRKENALCAGYNEQNGFSSVGAVLCTYAWDMLLERIGDNLMVFLLRYSSIFVLLTNRIYQQLTGPLLNKLVQGRKVDNPDGMQAKFCSNSAMDRLEKTLNYCSEVYKKRKRKFSWQRREKNGKV